MNNEQSKLTVFQDKGTIVSIQKVGETNFKAPPEPINWSEYERTGNNAIDLVAQYIGYHRAKYGNPNATGRKILRAVSLKPTSYMLFKAGIEAICGREIDPVTEFTFDGVIIKEGTWKQFETIQPEYVQRENRYPVKP